MKKGDIIKHVDLGDKFYLVFDVTDSINQIWKDCWKWLLNIWKISQKKKWTKK